ncbi:MAG TPA: hypothetical protein VF480_12350, partial [Verrucomicrobiae bacterium]
MALSCWNSYLNNYPGPADILVRCGSSVMLMNDNNLNPPYTFRTNFAFATEFSSWPGWGGVPAPKIQSASIVVPLNASVLTLTNAIYYYGGAANYKLLLAGDSPSNYLDRGIQPLPHFWLLMTNRLQVAIIDYSQGFNNGRIVDYVQLGGMDSSQLLNSALAENDPNSFWYTNYNAQGVLLGVYNQMLMSQYGTVNGFTPTGPGAWDTAQIPSGPAGNTTPAAQQAFFSGFFAKDGGYDYGGKLYVNPLSAMQVPYTPMVFAIQHTTWEANDPLVHYLASDLAPHTETPGVVDFDANNLRVTTDRYQPWGLATASGNGIDANPNNLSYKDPLVRGSDNWDFPADKLPTVGWLGRVHRGTPWQTVYLKASDVLNLIQTAGSITNYVGDTIWMAWTGNRNVFDATNAAPAQDRLLFDLFTTAINDNATRGQLSVNISSNSLAAWSALFSGVTVFPNNLPNVVVGSPTQLRYQHALPGLLSPGYSNLVINPAGVNVNNSALAQMAAGIDRTRATFVNADGLVGAFEHVGDILATPQLTEQAPFLNTGNVGQRNNGISDEMYEWLPQQAMSLLRVGTPRYVIYSYGQALKPAPLPNGVFVGG